MGAAAPESAGSRDQLLGLLAAGVDAAAGAGVLVDDPESDDPDDDPPDDPPDEPDEPEELSDDPDDDDPLVELLDALELPRLSVL